MSKNDDLEIDLDEVAVERISKLEIASHKDLDIDAGDSAASTKSIPIQDIEEVFENDRRYANQAYFMPNDDGEEIRLSIMHQVYLTALSGHLTLHRLKHDVRSILDVGAGPGDWAIAIAEAFPRCEVVATDIWPFQPRGLPPNLTYQVDDARLPWDFEEEFDFIHIRGLSGAFQDWSVVLRQAFIACSMQGNVEVTDISPVRYTTDNENSALKEYDIALREAASMAGLSLGLEHLQTEIIQNSGFRIFRNASIDIPIGQWQPESQKTALSKLTLVAVLEGLEAQALRLLTLYLNWSADQVRDLCNRVKNEIMTGASRPFITCRIVVLMKLPGFTS